MPPICHWAPARSNRGVAATSGAPARGRRRSALQAIGAASGVTVAGAGSGARAGSASARGSSTTIASRTETPRSVGSGPVIAGGGSAAAGGANGSSSAGPDPFGCGGSPLGSKGQRTSLGTSSAGVGAGVGAAGIANGSGGSGRGARGSPVEGPNGSWCAAAAATCGSSGPANGSDGCTPGGGPPGGANGSAPGPGAATPGGGARSGAAGPAGSGGGATSDAGSGGGHDPRAGSGGAANDAPVARPVPFGDGNSAVPVGGAGANGSAATGREKNASTSGGVSPPASDAYGSLSSAPGVPPAPLGSERGGRIMARRRAASVGEAPMSSTRRCSMFSGVPPSASARAARSVWRSGTRLPGGRFRSS